MRNKNSKTSLTIKDDSPSALDLFDPGKASVVYGREAEKESFLSFISSARSILHVSGKPGTGKTCTILDQCTRNQISYKYINYYHTPNIIVDDLIGPGEENVSQAKNIVKKGKRKNTKTSSIENKNNIKTNSKKLSCDEKIISGTNFRNAVTEVVIIDEFDKFYDEKKKAAILLIMNLRKKNIKLVTISNNLVTNQKNFRHCDNT